MNDKVSVIVPVYNVEKYLDQCIGSIIKQSYENIEIILIDDGSTDNSANICDKWEEKDSRIIVIHKKNGGLSSARNLGIDKSTGNYLVFVDSDDFIPNDAIEILVKLLKDNNADIAIGSGVNVIEDSNIIPNHHKKIKKELKFDAIGAISDLLYEKHFATGASKKIYKKELFEGITFPIGKKYEDLFTIYKLIYKAHKIVYGDYNVYYYLVRKNSIIGSINPQKCIDFMDASKNIYEFVKEKMPIIINGAKYKMFVASTELYVHYPRDEKVLTKNDVDNRNEMWIYIKKYRFQVLFGRNSKIKYRVLAAASYFGGAFLQKIFWKFAKR